jgi:ornithine cyclodeaminase/alanine dehydrogenase-like protein (mu-crystallin family)
MGSTTDPARPLLLSWRDVADLLGLADCIDAVERAFAALARGQFPAPPGVLGTHVPGGGFHVKTAALDTGFYAAKINANFPQNPRERALPAIQGVIVLFELGSGRPLAVLDSIEITILRTAAASAVAARHLARADAATVTICGCGNQGRSHLRALKHVRALRGAYAWDLDGARSNAFAVDMQAELGIPVQPVVDLAAAIAASELCVTCTPAQQPFFRASMLRPGLFVAAVGADSPEKQELEAAALSQALVVADSVAQTATIGELQHALAAGLMTVEDVHADLGQVVAGLRPGRTSDDQVFVFDSTGVALEDVAAAALVYERARRLGRGQPLML